ncbi:MAG: hypothetical protein SFU85_00315 [Candidatus Methylacidiphilales bacterium]|nr:hypothetical protein [Candidatus Methylacidiphilales bacterium]
MKITRIFHTLGILGFVLLSALQAQSPTPIPPPPEPPPQDQGLPYTRSADASALEIIRGGIAVFPGSRYAYVRGHRVRLSEKNLLRAEAVWKEGKLFVPASFIPVLSVKDPKPNPVPADLAMIADRWVYAPSEIVPASVLSKLVTLLPGSRDGGIPQGSASLTVRGESYVALEEVARAAGLGVFSHPSGLVFLGASAPVWPDSGSPRMDAVIALFDTPEKFADPSIAEKFIPNGARQKPWTAHVKVTPEQMALLNGPETEWEPVPISAYDDKGMDKTLLGSEVPAPGVYPRLFFSPKDLPELRRRIKNTISGQKSLIEMEVLFKKSWLDPKTSDGAIFEKLAAGNLEGLEWDVPAGKADFMAGHTFKGQKPGIYNSHIAYVPECLSALALYALLNDDDELGRRTATAVANYYKLREPLLDAFLKISDSEFGSSLRNPDGTLLELNAYGARTHWRNIHGLVAHMNLGPALDFSGKWMTPEQKDLMRRFIAKATYGRRSHGQDGPVRFRDVNWMAWDLPHFIAVAAIEGLPGFDAEAYASGLESARAFCQWGIDPSGVVFESNGKNPGAFQFQLLSMVIAARRGENLLAHPHWRKLLEGQALMTSPDGRVIVNSGTQYSPHSRQKLSMSLVNQFKGLYPDNRLADYLISTDIPLRTQPADTVGFVLPESKFDPVAYRALVEKTPRLRLPSPTYPGFTRNILFDGDAVFTERSSLGLPLDFNAPVHGVFSAYSSPEKDAAWMNMMVRPNHYLGAGHHHADAGMFHFSALGVNWITESPFTQWYTGNVHNLVQVDGQSQAEGIDGVVNGYNAAATYLGSLVCGQAAMASADLTYAYSWRWNTQPPQVWPEATRALGWEFDPSPQIARIFAGTARYKLRPWWSNYTYGNYIATSRAPFNPMQHVFRSVGLVRGDHPYGFVVDDLKKDEKVRHYQWTAMLNGGVWQAKVEGLPANAIALATTGQDTDLKAPPGKPVLEPKTGDPMVLVYALGMTQPEKSMPLLATETVEGQKDRKGATQYMDRLVIHHKAAQASFRVLLLPVRVGGPLPKVDYDPAKGLARVNWEGQVDELAFTQGDDPRTRLIIRRGGKTILGP